MEITGYKYLTEQDAINARKQCADFYGLPINPNDITQYWANYEIAFLDIPIFWYIIFDESIKEILGEPVKINVTNIL